MSKLDFVFQEYVRRFTTEVECENCFATQDIVKDSEGANAICLDCLKDDIENDMENVCKILGIKKVKKGKNE